MPQRFNNSDIERALASASGRRFRGRTISAGCLCLLLTSTSGLGSQVHADAPLRVLIIGGGPDLEDNQVAIESNVRYVRRLLPPGTRSTTLFADGDGSRSTVLYDEGSAQESKGQRILDLVIPGPDKGTPQKFRAPNIGPIDGASTPAQFARQIGRVAADPMARHGDLLLYFTGHGSPRKPDYENNVYDMWGKDAALSVREAAQQLDRLPSRLRVTLVMVQCYSGAFGNLLFDGGDPRGDAISRDFAGFYATVNTRVAAGCTSAVNEAEYHDFTSYFFAALTGRDRVGRTVTGCDYNGDGRVGMNEAYCYTLLNDESIDVPVCTSDFFLRRYVPMRDAEVFDTEWKTIVSWADSAQKQALEGLSAKLHLAGEDRLKAVYNRIFGDGADEGRNPQWLGRYEQARATLNQKAAEGWRRLNRAFPGLRAASGPAYERAVREAIVALNREATRGAWDDLLSASNAMERAEQEGEDFDVLSSKLLRIVRLGKSIVLAHELRQAGTTALNARYRKLIEAEGRTLLPPAGALPKGPAPKGSQSVFFLGTTRSPSSCN